MIANIKQKQFRKKDEEYIIGQIEKIKKKMNTQSEQIPCDELLVFRNNLKCFDKFELTSKFMNLHSPRDLDLVILPSKYCNKISMETKKSNLSKTFSCFLRSSALERIPSYRTINSFLGVQPIR